jgi:multiple sugar transport system substrate-binding protein
MLNGQNRTPIFKGGEASYNIEPVKGMLTTIKTMKDSKTFDNTLAGGPAKNASYASGHYIFYPSAPWVPRHVIKTNDKEGSGRWGIMKAPGGAYNWGGLTLSISSASKQKEAAWEFIKFVTLSEKGAKMQMDIAGEITPYKPIFTAQFFAGTDPFFAGQDIRSKFVEIGSDPKFIPLPLSIYDQALSTAKSIALDLIQKGDTSVDDALKAMTKDLDAKMKQ